MAALILMEQIINPVVNTSCKVRGLKKLLCDTEIHRLNVVDADISHLPSKMLKNHLLEQPSYL
jgi:hypothetical protein